MSNRGMGNRVKAGPVPATDVLLCERCGYVLDGVDGAGVCPECAQPIAESLPERRVGSAWQRHGTLRSFVSTVVDIHLRPTTVWTSLNVGGRDTQLAWLACTLCALSVSILGGASFLSVSRSFTQQYNYTASAVVVMMMMLLCVFFVVATFGSLLLTAIEARGVTFFVRRRGWRVPWKLAWAICTHAACTWWVAMAGLAIGLLLCDASLFVLPPNAGSSGFALQLQWLQRQRDVLFPLVGFTLGMLVFEVLVYRGVRVCRYANVPGLESRERELAVNAGQTTRAALPPAE